MRKNLLISATFVARPGHYNCFLLVLMDGWLSEEQVSCHFRINCSKCRRKFIVKFAEKRKPNALPEHPATSNLGAILPGQAKGDHHLGDHTVS